ncbi:TetR/AcrR family transcriptional regulator [Metallumcola ferriviriculae]|uniref:TetR/AcrR family transcriptional regulator n=1 Tax=Metallumcola ferriviriculae TaxID=3039180 RepID=A0AAU0URW4_9FIRM|nr:TetR/AcrR family transcriptional regulator [Desulfitibacteraceae bacterium MK1]
MTKNMSADHRRKQVIDAAICCLVERGYANFSVKDIAEEAGVSTGILYHYFKSKDDIMQEVLKEVFSRTDGAVRDSVGEKLQPDEILGTYLEFVGKLVRRDRLTYIVTMNYLGQVLYNDKMQMAMRRFFKNMRSYSSNTLERVFHENDREVGKKETDAVSAILIGVSLGLGIQSIVDEDNIDLDLCTEILYQAIMEK